MDRLALVAVALVALVTWEYAPALRGGFVYEDYKSVDACASSGLAGRLGTRALWCWQANGRQSLVAFHALNLSLHLLVVGLVAGLVWSLTGQAVPAGLAAAFFALNAVNVEAVAYLSGRSELLAAAGVLGACLAALYRRWVLVLPLAILGWDGKESAIVAVMLVPLCLWYTRRRAWGWACAGMGAIVGLAILLHTAVWWTYAGTPIRLAWASLQTTAIVRMGLLSVLPFGQTVDYDYTRVPVAIQVFAAVMLLAGLGWTWTQRANRLLVCGVAWVVCAAWPRLIVPTPQSIFPEHQFYLPLVGMALILASLVTQEPHGHYRPAL